jgi:DNA-binding NarL/FixJ family response regulator
MEKTIHIAIAYKSRCLRSSFIPYLKGIGPFEISIVANDESDLIRQLSNCLTFPDICMFGTCQEDFNSYAITTKILNIWPKANILIFTNISHPYVLMLLKNLGVKGFITWNSLDEELYNAIITVSNGKVYYSESPNCQLQKILSNKRKNSNNIFSANELEVMHYCGLHLSVKEIANKLNISKRTVDTYIKRIYTKADIHSKEELISLIVKIGI